MRNDGENDGAAAAVQPPAVDEGAGPAQPQPRNLLPFVIAAVLAISAGAFLYWWLYLRGVVSTDNAQVEGHVHEISARVAGHILEVFVSDNEEVKAGQLLVRLDPRDFEAALALRRAELASAKAAEAGARTNIALTAQNADANLDQANAGVQIGVTGLDSANKQTEQARAQIATAEANLRAAEASLEKAGKDLTRTTRLVLQAVAPQEELDAVEADHKVAMANAEAARTALQEARVNLEVSIARAAQTTAGIGFAKGRLKAAQTGPLQVSAARDAADQSASAVQQAEAALRQAELNLSYTQITASVDGLVSKKRAEKGAQVVVGQPLMAIVPLEDTWIVANFKETEITHMQAGQKAKFTVDAYPGRTFHGTVDSIAAGTGARFSLLPPENATGNFVKVVQRIPVKIRMERADAGEMPVLRPGMNAIVTVDVGH